jgi:hypothetical protein
MFQHERVSSHRDVFVAVLHIHHDAKSNGDTWDYIGADDDNLYSFGCATLFDDPALTNSVNLTTVLNPGSSRVNTANTYTFAGASSACFANLKAGSDYIFLLEFSIYE